MSVHIYSPTQLCRDTFGGQVTTQLCHGTFGGQVTTCGSWFFLLQCES